VSAVQQVDLTEALNFVGDDTQPEQPDTPEHTAD
jgi:hypothetical protein